MTLEKVIEIKMRLPTRSIPRLWVVHLKLNCSGVEFKGNKDGEDMARYREGTHTRERKRVTFSQNQCWIRKLVSLNQQGIDRNHHNSIDNHQCLNQIILLRPDISCYLASSDVQLVRHRFIVQTLCAAEGAIMETELEVG